jgi:hypothetical protein
MEIFEVGKVVLKIRIENEDWIFEISEVFHLSEEEYAKNDAYNDTLGNYDPKNEKPTESVATIRANSSSGEIVILRWSYSAKGVYPHIRQKAWSKSLFIKLNNILRNWRFGIV